jgi:hypothetical protein
VETHARTLGLDPVQFQQQLTSFEQRRVIRHDRDSGRLTPVPPVFASWLAEHAVTELLTVIPDEAAHARAEQQRAEARVAASEIAELTRSWPPYRGRAIDGDQVRAWLEQFGDDVDQRRAYQVLRSLRFASDGVVRSAFREIHRSLMAGQNRTPATKAKFRDVLIVSPDPPGKSGPVYTRLYAQESSTHLSNITDLRQLHDRISTSGSSVRFVVVVDDFIGSGHSMADRLLELDDSTIEEMKQRDIQTSVVVYAATADGLAHLENALEGRGLDWAIRSHVTIGNDERVFSPAGSVFDSGAEREATKALFANVGTRLVPNAPLGYGDCELALTFEGNIPNNSLPPLWSRGPGWTPLFPRL